MYLQKGIIAGIGLYNAHEIISKYNHVFLDTEIQDKYFVQRLQVSKKNNIKSRIKQSAFYMQRKKR